MDNSLNQSIIEKVITKNVAIHIALNTMCPPPFEDKFKNESLCQKNIPTQNSEKSLNVVEPNNVNAANDTMNNTKTNSEEKSWRDITDPKLREKAYKKAYRDANKDKIKDYAKSYYKDNKNVLKSKMEVYRKTNSHKQKVYNKAYYEVNKEKIKKSTANYGKTHRYETNKHRKNRRKTDIQYKLRKILRSRLYDCLKHNYKNGSSLKDLGCSINELKSYLESKFQPGMNWDNHGLRGWHIDHIKPLASFDLSDRNQLLEACHYTNLQPLWAKDNLAKSNKIIPPSLLL